MDPFTLGQLNFGLKQLKYIDNLSKMDDYDAGYIDGARHTLDYCMEGFTGKDNWDEAKKLYNENKDKSGSDV